MNPPPPEDRSQSAKKRIDTLGFALLITGGGLLLAGVIAGIPVALAGLVLVAIGRKRDKPRQ